MSFAPSLIESMQPQSHSIAPDRFVQITQRYANLKIAIAGDFCLDRYLEIDPTKQEVSIETGLPVHNVIRVRSQPGAAGTILNNLVALGVGEIFPIGFCGEDGEGWELQRALAAKERVNLSGFLQTADRRTFTYAKPLVLHPGLPPQELNRLDSKNWSPTPSSLSKQLGDILCGLADQVDAVILMDQVDLENTGVITREFLQIVGHLSQSKPDLLILGDSRRSLNGFPPITFKMNRAELARFLNQPSEPDLTAVQVRASALAKQQGHPVFVTLSEHGILGASPSGQTYHVPCLPIRGPIDIVGAGDAVTANLTAALSAGADLKETMILAMIAASIVVHQLGTTGTATLPEIQSFL